MSVQELVDYCKENNISLDTAIAIRAKDDYLVTKEKLSMDTPYFGNCDDGREWEKTNVPKDDNGDPNYDKMPSILILDTGRG